ncbi:MAG: hypothetical protein H6907_11535 [Hyphomicrobiales bacterium]|nr:hypothetical protein [Hyphomicrobiales bacterium]MCP5372354.1 hypothetical protein [Hyphomicrobiales bacterium]
MDDADATLRALAGRLPDLVHRAFDAYETTATRPVPDDAKGAAAQHGACKAALVHLEALIELHARLIAPPDPAPGAPGAPEGAEALLARARAALAEIPSP